MVYNLRDETSAFVLGKRSREMSLSDHFQNHPQKRYKFGKYVDKENATHDPNEFVKEMNCRIMDVQINSDSFVRNGFLQPSTYRSVEVKHDEFGAFLQL